MEDGLTCADIDECGGLSPAVCSQLCINTAGSYQCDCHPGYIMEADGHHCKITGSPLADCCPSLGQRTVSQGMNGMIEN